MRHRRTCAARADLHHAVQRHVAHLAPERLGESRPVGVVADVLAVREHDRVNGPERAGVVGEVVQKGIIACLQGWVMLSPLKPMRCAAVSSSGRASTPRPSFVRSISR